MRFLPLLFVMALVLGCAPVMECAPPSKLLGDKCCLDDDSDGVCDAVAEVVEEPVPEVPEQQPVEEAEVAPEPKVVTKPQPKPVEPEPVAELKPGKFTIQYGEPKKYVEILDLKLHRYSADKVMLDEVWYVARNVGTKTWNPEIRLRAENVRTGDSDYGMSGVEQTYNLEPLKPGEKQVIKLPMGLRYSQMNKTKTLTFKAYERFTAPKEVLGEQVYSFIPEDELDSMEISWLPGDD